MASVELEELIRQAEKLPLNEQLYLIARLAEKAWATGSNQKPEHAEPLIGEELASLLEQIDGVPYTPHPDGRTDISTSHDDILYPKLGQIP